MYLRRPTVQMLQPCYMISPDVIATCAFLYDSTVSAVCEGCVPVSFAGMCVNSIHACTGVVGTFDTGLDVSVDPRNQVIHGLHGTLLCAGMHAATSLLARTQELKHSLRLYKQVPLTFAARQSNAGISSGLASEMQYVRCSSLLFPISHVLSLRIIRGSNNQSTGQNSLQSKFWPGTRLLGYMGLCLTETIVLTETMGLISRCTFKNQTRYGNYQIVCMLEACIPAAWCM